MQVKLLRGYLVAIALVLLAGVGQWYLDIETSAYVLFYPAVFFASLLGGMGPGFVSVSLSILVREWMVLGHPEPASSSWTGLLAFTLMGIAMVWANARQRQTSRALVRSEGQMHAELLKTQAAEEALFHQRRRLELITDANPGLICYMDAKYRYQFVNKSFEKWFGVKREKLLGRQAIELKESAVIVLPYLKRAFAGDAVKFEYHMDKGINKYVHVQYVPDFDSQRRVRGVFGLITDLSERRKQELLLKESQERLQLALASTKMGTWDWQVGSNKVVWDTTAESLCGLAPGAFSGTVEHFHEMVLPEDRAILEEQSRQALESGEPWKYEYRVRWPDGSIHWLCGTGRALYDSVGRPQRMVGTVMEVTKEKQITERTMASEQRYRSLVQATSAVVWLADKGGAFVHPQPSWAAYTGQAWPEHSGWDWLDMVHPEDREACKSQWSFAMNRAIPYEYEGRLWNDQYQSYRHFNCRAVPVLNRNGSVKEWIGMIQDIEERKRWAKELEQLTQELAQAVRVRDDFLSIASHELKTPLTAIRLQTQLLSLKAQREPSGALPSQLIVDKLAATDRLIQRLDTLISDLLDVSRIINKKLALVGQEVDLEVIVRDVASRFEEQCMITQSPLILDCQEDTIGWWDPQRLDQVLTNLISNAVKYGKGHPIYLSLRKEADFAVLRVKDSGIGIPKQFQNRIFDRFERVSERSGIGGLGLGLYIVRQIVELHFGRIEVESEANKGACFTVYLPLSPALAKAKSAPMALNRAN